MRKGWRHSGCGPARTPRSSPTGGPRRPRAGRAAGRPETGRNRPGCRRCRPRGSRSGRPRWRSCSSSRPYRASASSWSRAVNFRGRELTASPRRSSSWVGHAGQGELVDVFPAQHVGCLLDGDPARVGRRRVGVVPHRERVLGDLDDLAGQRVSRVLRVAIDDAIPDREGLHGGVGHGPQATPCAVTTAQPTCPRRARPRPGSVIARCSRSRVVDPLVEGLGQQGVSDGGCAVPHVRRCPAGRRPPRGVGRVRALPRRCSPSGRAAPRQRPSRRPAARGET